LVTGFLGVVKEEDLTGVLVLVSQHLVEALLVEVAPTYVPLVPGFLVFAFEIALVQLRRL
jgi:hypothetical protein